MPPEYTANTVVPTKPGRMKRTLVRDFLDLVYKKTSNQETVVTRE